VDVRRSSDGSTQGFTAAEVADGTLTAWVGAGNDGTVSKWYDQSGNDNHAVQTTPANQPTIVDGGALVAGGLSFDAGLDCLDLPTVISSINAASSFVVAKTTNASLTQSALSLSIFNSPQLARFYAPFAIGGSFYFGYGSDATAINLGLADTSEHLFTATAGSSTAEGFIDGTSGGTVSSVDLYSQQTQGGIGNINGTTEWVGTIREIIIYPSDQSDNRTAIEANIGEYYGITGIPAYDNTVDGFVETWYDQSGNGNDATQSVAASQPKIVDAGVLVSDGIKFDGVDDFFDFTNNLNFYNNPCSLFATCGASNFPLLGNNSNRRVVFNSSEIYFYLTVFAQDFNHNQALLSGLNQFSVIHNGTSTSPNSSAYLNSVENDPTASSGGSALANDSTNFIGKNSGLPSSSYDSFISEIIIYDSDQSANRTAIEDNINTYYNIYP
jgi:hypothetical protein